MIDLILLVQAHLKNKQLFKLRDTLGCDVLVGVTLVDEMEYELVDLEDSEIKEVLTSKLIEDISLVVEVVVVVEVIVVIEVILSVVGGEVVTEAVEDV